MTTIPSNMDAALSEQVFVSMVGDVPSLAASNLYSFFLEVHRCCARHLEFETNLSGSACAFVLSERVELDPIYEKYSSEFAASPRLDDQKQPSIPGPIILTTRNLRLAFSKSCSDTTMAGVADELKKIGLGDRATAVFVPAHRTLVFYPNGVNNKATFRADHASLKQLNPADVPALLEYFHQNFTRYPDGVGTCWDNATERIVERNAERNVRNHLFVFLSMVVYGSDYITREHQLPNGRADIFIYGFVYGNKEDSRVLELKVLRSKSIGWKKGMPSKAYSDKVNKGYVEKGMRQAHRYKKAIGAFEAYLCCFDARLKDVEIDVADYAVSLGVIYRRYFMESSTEV